MIDFGYTVNSDRQIDYDQGNLKLSRFLEENEPTFRICISCGSCTATCTAGSFTDLNLRAMIVKIKRGEISRLRNEIAKCMLCGKCQLVCPRGVNTRNLLLSIHRAVERLEL